MNGRGLRSVIGTQPTEKMPSDPTAKKAVVLSRHEVRLNSLYDP